MNEENEMKKTVFVDIDGCLIEHYGNLSVQISKDPILLTGTIEKLNEWDAAGYKIILITGRRESARKITEKQLASVGIFYDQLIMGLPRGERILINDKKIGRNNPVARAIELTRNYGIGDIKI